MSETINIIGLAGSIRRKSITKVLLQAAQKVAPDAMQITLFPLNEIPIYNNDVEVEEGFPPPVAELRQAIAHADGLILATPEYNGSLTGVLKNSIDWASRKGLLAQKPVVTMGGSPGALGATKAQEHLRQICLHLGMYVMPKPTIAVPKLPDKIVDGQLTDELTCKFLKEQMEQFYHWVVRLKE
ncbi:NADPH-dependent FMN reductase [Candidatus Leptofilum sp.]|uniref:NADPH-dependent FMN reductase n=1 Tax=Candidatus Leptofilum sp. TaxID=3241576 RepID=UPI003B595C09